MDRASFYESLYSLEGIRERFVAVCEHPRKGSEFHKVERFLSGWVREEYLNHKCYYSVGLAESEPARGRGTRENIRALPTIWADIDFSEKEDCKKPYPTEQQAMDALDRMPLKPSAIVMTGGGIHAYWFVEDRDIDRVGEVELVCRQWQELYRRKLEAIQEGLTIDSTHDASRILRIPDTINKGRHVRVELLEGQRYEIVEFDQLLVTKPAPIVLPNHGEGVELDGTVEAIEFAAKLELLLTNSTDFKSAWTHRKKLPSSSEYELSLATHAVNAGWSNAEISRLIIWHRSKWDPLKVEKARREDYLRRTIGLARQGWHGSSLPNIEDDVDRAEAVAGAVTPEDGDKALLEAFSKIVGIKVKRIVQYGREALSAKIVLEMEDGTQLPLGTFQTAVFEYKRVRTAMMAAYGLLLPAMGNERWTRAIASTRPAWEVIADEELDSIFILKDLLEQYAYEHPPSNKEDIEILRSNYPIVRDGMICVNTAGFKTWLERRKHRVDSADIRHLFKWMGLSRKKYGAWKGTDAQVGRWYWITPFMPVDDRGEEM